MKLIVKISEGSVRDALSLLDRGLLSLNSNNELDLDMAQKIFGYFEKSQLIDLFELILKGQEDEVIKIYRKIYDKGIEPKVFINDFLELIYYFKNIESLTLESTNFSLNSDEYHRIKNLSSSVENKDLILIWQFTIKTLEELDIVSNQHLSIEMFLIRILHLRSLNKKDDTLNNEQPDQLEKVNFEYKNKENDYVDQIKSVTQEKKLIQ